MAESADGFLLFPYQDSAKSMLFLCLRPHPETLSFEQMAKWYSPVAGRAIRKGHSPHYFRHGQKVLLPLPSQVGNSRMCCLWTRCSPADSL